MDEQAALPAPAMDENKEAIPSMAPPGKEDGMALRSDAVAPPGKKDEMALRSDADAEMWKVNPVAMLGNGGVILVLFETPSGFALFSYDGLKLFQPDAIHNIWGEFVKDFMRPVWLKDFKPFKDKLFGDDYSTLVKDAPKYKDKLREVACFRVYEEMLWARKLRFKGLKRLATLARMAREDYETEQAMRNPGEIPEV